MIRSLSRGLETLAFLNRRDSATAAEITRELGIPRATVYRILITLCQSNLVRQHESDQRYRITPDVRALSVGFTDEDHMVHLSEKYLQHVTSKLSWPVALATISGVDVIVRENTDQMSPLAVEKFSSGYRMSILRTASGLCILAHMDEERQKLILDTLDQIDRNQGHVIRQRKTLIKKLREIQRRGFSVHHRHRRHSDLTAMAVPIIPLHGQVRGAVTIRYARRAVKLQSAICDFRPELDAAAQRIAERIRMHDENQTDRVAGTA